MMHKKVFIMLCFLLAGVSSWAQSLTVSGNVVSKTDGQPIIGASVVETNDTRHGTVTDIDGNFTLTVANGSDITVSYLGYQSVTIRAIRTMNIVLAEDVELLNEVVVTGYMSEKKADLTGSVSVVKMKDVADIPTGNVLSSLQGRIPGMNISTDGTPGGMNTSIRVRGTTTINNSSPLYVIDGVMTRDNIASILAAGDVESIQVLKDAASASIYGAQAANGVIIITTKRAKAGEIKVDFDLSLTQQTFATGIDMLNTQQWGDVYWQAYKNTYGTTPNSAVYGSGPTAVPQEFYYDRNGIKIRTADTDWTKLIFNSALMQNYNVTLSKGADNGATTLTLNFIDQDGLTRNTDFMRFNTRLASDYRFLNNRLRIGESVAVNHWKRHLNPSGIEEQILAQHPAIPVYDENGGYAGGYVDILGDKPNPIRLTDQEKNNRHTAWRIFGNAYIEIEPIKNLVVRSNFGVNYTTAFNSTFIPKWREGARSLLVNTLNVSSNYSLNWVWTNTATYRIELNKHSISALAGMEAKRDYSENLSGSGTGLSVEDIDYRYLSAVTGGQTVGNSASTYAMVSYFGKLNYAYDERYLLSGTVRRDASSRFGRQNNAGIFPAVSGGWRISREAFMQTTSDWLSDLKLRVSWGVNGNDQINNEATYTKYLVSLPRASYNINGDGSTLAPGAYKTISANPALRWEETEQINFGIDAAFLQNRLNLSLDYFNKNTRDMLVQRDYIAVIGEGGGYYYNAIGMNNKGIEATVQWRDRKGDFIYDIAMNLSYYRNKVTELPQDIYYTYGGGDGVSQTLVGQPLGSWMGYKTDGLFRTQAEVDEYKSKYTIEIGDPGVGRIRYLDVNGDDRISSNDRTWLGSDNPQIIGGINFNFGYKGFDMSLFFNGMIRDAYNNAKYYTDIFQGWTGNHSTRLLDAMDAWTDYESTGVYNGKYPSLTVSNSNSETRTSEWFIENGSYIKLKSLSIGYTLPTSVVKKLSMRHARIYLQSQNLLTLTKYTGADPEGLGYPYPMPRTFTLGLSFGF
jgi:TonB-linked SusC/RagA family outer membrane protein